MRYIDSGSRREDQALGRWLTQVVSESIVEIRIQSGFFIGEALGLLASTFEAFGAANRLVRVLIGSNGPGSAYDDVRLLAQLLQLPRPNAGLGVVRYSNAFFHPKVYHFRRSDGSQCAYVGSSNLTPQGLTAQHIEAGILLDTTDSDPVDVLDSIAAAIDEWFTTPRDGLSLVINVEGLLNCWPKAFWLRNVHPLQFQSVIGVADRGD